MSVSWLCAKVSQITTAVARDHVQYQIVLLFRPCFDCLNDGTRTGWKTANGNGRDGDAGARQRGVGAGPSTEPAAGGAHEAGDEAAPQVPCCHPLVIS